MYAYLNPIRNESDDFQQYPNNGAVWGLGLRVLASVKEYKGGSIRRQLCRIKAHLACWMGPYTTLPYSPPLNPYVSGFVGLTQHKAQVHKNYLSVRGRAFRGLGF